MRTGQRRRTIASYVPPRALGPGARAGLEKLGYRVIPAVSRGRFEDASWRADVRLVGERTLPRAPRDATPVILVTDDPAQDWSDERILGVVPSPAGLAPLYATLQRILEEHPRNAMRVPVSLAAKCRAGDRGFSGEVVQLSERGCRIESDAGLPETGSVDMLLRLPPGLTVSVRADVRSRRGATAGLEFAALPAPARQAVSEYVQRRLLLS